MLNDEIEKKINRKKKLESTELTCQTCDSCNEIEITLWNVN